MNVKNMIITFFYANASTLAMVVLAFLAGEAVSFIDTINSHPGIISIFAGALAALSVKYVDKWLDGRNKTIQTGDEILKIEAAKQQRLEQQQQALLAEKESYWKLQNDRLRAELFEAQQRNREERREAANINHKAINQLMQQQSVILGMQREMVLNGLPLPDISKLELTKFMLPIWETEKDGIHKTGDAIHKTGDAIHNSMDIHESKSSHQD